MSDEQAARIAEFIEPLRVRPGAVDLDFDPTAAGVVEQCLRRWTVADARPG